MYLIEIAADRGSAWKKLYDSRYAEWGSNIRVAELSGQGMQITYDAESSLILYRHHLKKVCDDSKCSFCVTPLYQLHMF